jgi:hypothetical protein
MKKKTSLLAATKKVAVEVSDAAVGAVKAVVAKLTPGKAKPAKRTVKAKAKAPAPKAKPVASKAVKKQPAATKKATPAKTAKPAKKR